MESNNNMLLEELKKNFISQSKTESDQLNELYSAMAKAQAEMKGFVKNKKGVHNSEYADLREVVETSRPALTKFGLSVIQLLKIENGVQMLCTRLCHSSGQWIESKSEIRSVKNHVHELASYITYFRRYHYVSIICGIDTQEDDDGNSAMPNKISNSSKINEGQLKMLQSAIKRKPEAEIYLLKKVGVKSWAELTQDEFKTAYNIVCEELTRK